MIFSELNSFLDIVTKLRSSRKKSEQPELSIRDRFVGIFQKHGVGLNQIPRFLDDGLTVANVQNENALLPYLTEERLHRVCNLLAIKRGWLDGTETAIFPEHFFYKHPEEFAEFLTRHKIEYCYLLYPQSRGDASAGYRQINFSKAHKTLGIPSNHRCIFPRRQGSQSKVSISFS